MVDVRRNDRPAAGDLVAHELGRDMVGQAGAEGFAVAEHGLALGAADILADGDELHLGRDDAAPRVFQLRHRGAALGAQRPMADREFADQLGGARIAVVLGLNAAAECGLDVATRRDPGFAQARQALVDVDARRGIGVGARTVVDAHRRLAGTRVERDLAHRHAQIGMGFARHIHLARCGQRAGHTPNRAAAVEIERSSGMGSGPLSVNAGQRRPKGGDVPRLKIGSHPYAGMRTRFDGSPRCATTHSGICALRQGSPGIPIVRPDRGGCRVA